MDDIIVRTVERKGEGAERPGGDPGHQSGARGCGRRPAAQQPDLRSKHDQRRRSADRKALHPIVKTVCEADFAALLAIYHAEKARRP